jgi:hypothetical protein
VCIAALVDCVEGTAREEGTKRVLSKKAVFRRTLISESFKADRRVDHP